MLILARRLGESIKIQPAEGLPPETPIQALFADGLIEIVVIRLGSKEVKLGIGAHPDFVILRDELCD